MRSVVNVAGAKYKAYSHFKMLRSVKVMKKN